MNRAMDVDVEIAATVASIAVRDASPQRDALLDIMGWHACCLR